jgi:hypothetical protein
MDKDRRRATMGREDCCAMRSTYATIICVTAALAVSAPAAIAAATTGEPSATSAPANATRKQPDTLKSRLSDKASDEQRVNDCKVPPERRGPKKRPTECAAADADPASQPAASAESGGK